jgi:paraquat-inducible protein B
MELRIKAGLRASLQAESLVTGVLYIEMRPNPRATQPVYHQLKKIYNEIPTEPTQIQAMMENLGSLDIKGISTNINNLIVRLDALVENMRMGEISAGVTNTLASVNRLLASPDITNSLASAKTTLDQYRLLGEKLNARLDPLTESITNSLAEANRTLVQLRGTADNLRTALRPDSPLQHNLDQLLRQLAGTAESVSTLMEFLKQHPNALITGREMPQKP